MMKLRQHSITFIGHIISQEGLQPDPGKILAMRDMPSPTDDASVRRVSVNGFMYYLTKFLTGLSDAMEPIRRGKLFHGTGQRSKKKQSAK